MSILPRPLIFDMDDQEYALMYEPSQHGRCLSPSPLSTLTLIPWSQREIMCYEPIISSEMVVYMGITNDPTFTYVEAPPPYPPYSTEQIFYVKEEITIDTSGLQKGDDKKQNAWTCDHCNKTFARKQNMEKHFLHQHADPNSDWVILKKLQEKASQKKSASEKRFNCSGCTLSFSYKHHMKEHFMRMHEDPENVMVVAFKTNANDKKRKLRG